MFKKKFWLPALIIVISVCAITAFWLTLHNALATRKTAVCSEQAQGQSPDEFQQMTMKIPGAEKNGYWELNIKNGKSLQDGAILKDIEGQYFSDKKPIYQISSKNGTIDWKTRTLELKNSVLLKTVDNSKILTTTELVWNPNSKKITARQGVTLQALETLISTDELFSDLTLEQVELKGMTKVIYQRAK
jgi:LPS export ABC transporter protein LptC